MIGDLCCIETQPENMAAVNTRASVFAVFIFQGFALWNGKADFGVQWAVLFAASGWFRSGTCLVETILTCNELARSRQAHPG